MREPAAVVGNGLGDDRTVDLTLVGDHSDVAARPDVGAFRRPTARRRTWPSPARLTREQGDGEGEGGVDVPQAGRAARASTMATSGTSAIAERFTTPPRPFDGCERDAAPEPPVRSRLRPAPPNAPRDSLRGLRV